MCSLSRKTTTNSGAFCIVGPYTVSFENSTFVSGFRTTIKRHGWLFKPEGAHLPASIMLVTVSSHTFSSVNPRMLLRDFMASLVSMLSSILIHTLEGQE